MGSRLVLAGGSRSPGTNFIHAKVLQRNRAAAKKKKKKKKKKKHRKKNKK
eukprot:NODE_27698_length_504_cov_1.588859.p5 GENE.NODE_27698_length_504_cov_1.588859~~NODE_27698_length_504_cov_1.588859.p5  ORF type:complete len:50 (-),score=29.65 NODE_27698_length_504_cov_1.588859:90-239(-)